MLEHILETGQRFTPAARRAVWEHTRGQPWLVNALCAGACFKSEAGRDRSRAIGVEDINAAREELILSRRTHLDQLAHKLEEERVRRVVEPLLVNGGGRIEREYGLGRGRTDLLVLWPREAGQPYDLWRRFVIECKVLRDSDRKSLEATVERGVEQTLGYMGKCGAEEGHLVAFDRREGARERAHGEHRAEDGGRVTVWTL